MARLHRARPRRGRSSGVRVPAPRRRRSARRPQPVPRPPRLPWTTTSTPTPCVMADVAAQTVLLLQANAPPGIVAAELEAGADFQLRRPSSAGHGGRPARRHRRRRRSSGYGPTPSEMTAPSPTSLETSWPERSASTRRAGEKDSGTVKTSVGSAYGSGDPMSRETLLARTLVDLADTLVADFDVVELLTRLADALRRRARRGSRRASCWPRPTATLRVMASSSEAMRVLELFELQAQKGPCLDCYRTGTPVVNQNLAAGDDRWPRLRGRGARRRLPRPSMPCPCGCGARSSAPSTCSMSSRVRCGRPTSRRGPGVRRRRHHRHPPAPRRDRGACAQRAAHRRAQQPHRDRAGEGHGRRASGLDMEHAFATLRNHARNHNLRLADVATDVIEGSLAARQASTRFPRRGSTRTSRVTQSEPQTLRCFGGEACSPPGVHRPGRW